MNDQCTAHYLANRYPQRVVVTLNCGHEGAKSKHHPDYSKPYEVELLCHKCHGKHVKERIIEKPAKAPRPLTYQVSSIRIHIEKMERERERLGMSKAEIERRAKLKPSGYSKVLVRRVTSISTLNRIADALYLDPKDLLTN
jgi:hypothetical protein